VSSDIIFNRLANHGRGSAVRFRSRRRLRQLRRQQQLSGELTITISSDRSADEDEQGNAQHNQAPREERDYESEKASDERDASNDD
jgi:hypothetical protein